MAERRKSPGSPGDSVAIAEPAIRVVDSADAIVKASGWTTTDDVDAVGGSFLEYNIPGGSMSVEFSAASLWVRFRLGADCGKAVIQIDGTVTATVDLYNAQSLYKYVNVAMGLTDQAHVLAITVDSAKNASSTDYYVRADAFALRSSDVSLSIHDIEYIDLINVINTINLINKIGIISTIANVELLSTITKINNISTIGSISVIAEISRIKRIDVVFPSQQIIQNGGFETGDVTAWHAGYVGGSVGSVNSIYVNSGDYAGYLSGVGSVAGLTLMQELPPLLTDDVRFSLWHLTYVAETLRATIFYTDGTTSTHDDLGQKGYAYFTFTPTSNKYLESVRFETIADGVESYLDDIQAVVQPTKNLSTLGFLSQISDIAGISTVGKVAVLSQISTIGTLSQLSEVSLVKVISQISTVSLVKVVSTVELIDDVMDVVNVKNVSIIGFLSTLSLVHELSYVDNVKYVDSLSQIHMLSQLSEVSLVKVLSQVSTIGFLSNISTIDQIKGLSSVGFLSQISDIAGVSTIGRIAVLSQLSTIGTMSQLSEVSLVKVLSQVSTIGFLSNISTIDQIKGFKLLTHIAWSSSFGAGGGNKTSTTASCDAYGRIGGYALLSNTGVVQVQQAGDGTTFSVVSQFSIVSNVAKDYNVALILDSVRLYLSCDGTATSAILAGYLRLIP